MIVPFLTDTRTALTPCLFALVQTDVDFVPLVELGADVHALGPNGETFLTAVVFSVLNTHPPHRRTMDFVKSALVRALRVGADWLKTAARGESALTTMQFHITKLVRSKAQWLELVSLFEQLGSASQLFHLGVGLAALDLPILVQLAIFRALGNFEVADARAWNCLKFIKESTTTTREQ